MVAAATGASTIVYEPSLYFSERDSPFYGGIIDNTGNGIWLEDFEDQQLNTPFVRQEDDRSRKGTTFREKFSFPGVSSIWGVDGDDGAIDGHTSAGDVWISTNTNGGGPSQIMSFQFEPNEDGNYPLYVGLVITRPNNFFSQVEVRWNDLDGNSIYDDEYDMTEWAPPERCYRRQPSSPTICGALPRRRYRPNIYEQRQPNRPPPIRILHPRALRLFTHSSESCSPHHQSPPILIHHAFSETLPHGIHRR